MLAWGKKVSKPFRDRVTQIGTSLQLDPNFLMACIAFESNETFSASVQNAAGSGAVGLIQFMPGTAQANDDNSGMNDLPLRPTLTISLSIK